jgi:hypothetical protein
VAGETNDPAPVTLSEVLSARRASGIPPLYGCLRPPTETSNRGLSMGSPCGRTKSCHTSDGYSSCLSSLSTPPLQNCLESKSGKDCLTGPPKHVLLSSSTRYWASSMTQKCSQVLWWHVLTCPSTWWLMVCPENQGPTCEKYNFLDFGGGDWCSRPWSGLTVAGEPKALYNHLLCCLTNLHAAFWLGNPSDKLTRSVTDRLLVIFFRVSVLDDISSTLEEDLTPSHVLWSEQLQQCILPVYPGRQLDRRSKCRPGCHGLGYQFLGDDGVGSSTSVEESTQEQVMGSIRRYVVWSQ